MDIVTASSILDRVASCASYMNFVYQVINCILVMPHDSCDSYEMNMPNEHATLNIMRCCSEWFIMNPHKMNSFRAPVINAIAIKINNCKAALSVSKLISPNEIYRGPTGLQEFSYWTSVLSWKVFVAKWSFAFYSQTFGTISKLLV